MGPVGNARCGYARVAAQTDFSTRIFAENLSFCGYFQTREQKKNFQSQFILLCRQLKTDLKVFDFVQDRAPECVRKFLLRFLPVLLKKPSSNDAFTYQLCSRLRYQV
ncbi:unnamed protein product [Amoebophrya sp. A120]|nr:unnamed protein product [Amoebophrya sp. A120]|eukprot:GSA120T00006179001.1